MTQPSLLFYCQHSVGMGHLMRSLALARALAERVDVTLVVGGRVPKVANTDGVRIVGMPPVGLDEHGALVSRDGRRGLARALEDRRTILLQTYRALRPQAIVIELFPFGRHKFAAELEPMLSAARQDDPAPLVCCSLRDILVSRTRQPRHDHRTAELLSAYFDTVLVHSDPRFARLQQSLDADVHIPVPVYHTGFVHERGRQRLRPQIPPRSVIVSAGGGLVGEPLLRTALDAQSILPARSRRPMTIVAGPFLPEAAWQRLRRRAGSVPDVTVRRSVSDLAGELRHAAASISQCGYNTAMDLIESRVSALVVPFGEGDEDEQRKRAHRLETLGAVRVLAETQLTPERLAAEIAGLRSFCPAATALSLRGAECATDIIAGLLRDRAMERRDGSRRSA